MGSRSWHLLVWGRHRKRHSALSSSERQEKGLAVVCSKQLDTSKPGTPCNIPPPLCIWERHNVKNKQLCLQKELTGSPVSVTAVVLSPGAGHEKSQSRQVIGIASPSVWGKTNTHLFTRTGRLCVSSGGIPRRKGLLPIWGCAGTGCA